MVYNFVEIHRTYEILKKVMLLQLEASEKEQQLILFIKINSKMTDFVRTKFEKPWVPLPTGMQRFVVLLRDIKPQFRDKINIIYKKKSKFSKIFGRL